MLYSISTHPKKKGYAWLIFHNLYRKDNISVFLLADQYINTNPNWGPFLKGKNLFPMEKIPFRLEYTHVDIRIKNMTELRPLYLFPLND